MKVYKGTVSDMDWEVTVDGQPLNPRYDLRNHSPDGFSWGYAGSGPAQLALAILCDHLNNDDLAQHIYQDFKFKAITTLPMNEGFELTSDEVQRIVSDIIGEISHQILVS
jgi:hypothetical protein